MQEADAAANIPSANATSSRPYGWVDLKIAHGATINSTTPMIVLDNGYKTKFEFRMPKVTMLTSLNYATLLTANKFKVSANEIVMMTMMTTVIWDLLLAHGGYGHTTGLESGPYLAPGCSNERREHLSLA